MNLETRATAKRIATLLCSAGTIVGYAYLIGGAGGYLFGKGKPLHAALGFVVGSILAVVAIKIWRSYLIDVEELNRRDGTHS